MKRSSGSFRNSGAYTSPGTPEYGENNGGELPKSWHSERVPLPTNNSSSSRRHIGANALMSFNGGRALPSKWDDAERWITSPVSGYSNPFALPQRQTKSKSGPLAPQGLGYLSNYSSNVLESDNMRSFMGNSPLTTGVLVPDGLSIHYKSSSLYGVENNNISRSISVPELSDSLSSVRSSQEQDEKLDDAKEEEPVVVSRRDMATQMSPNGSTNSSPKGRPSISTLPSSFPTLRNSAIKDEIRDVQIDKGTTTSRQSKKQGTSKKLKNLVNIEDVPSSWNATGTSKDTSRLQRDEAKITAWENLQKAKAEAAIRKLEMKLEKKRSASTDTIMNKLRAAQMRAEALRNSLIEKHARQSSKSFRGERISCCVYVKIRSLGNCFLSRSEY